MSFPGMTQRGTYVRTEVQHEPNSRSTGGSLMSSKRFLTVAMAGLFAVSALAADSKKVTAAKDTEGANKPAAVEAAKAASADEEKAPRLTIVEPVKDYGIVPKGDKLEWAFLVKNTGDADLQIIAAKPGCGCTVADFDKVIKPGSTGKVTAHVDTTAFAGPIAKTVSVETNDPSNPMATLTIHATVKPYVEAAPVGFVRYSLLQGETSSQSVVLYSEEDEPF